LTARAWRLVSLRVLSRFLRRVAEGLQDTKRRERRGCREKRARRAAEGVVASPDGRRGLVLLSPQQSRERCLPAPLFAKRRLGSHVHAPHSTSSRPPCPSPCNRNHTCPRFDDVGFFHNRTPLRTRRCERCHIPRATLRLYLLFTLWHSCPGPIQAYSLRQPDLPTGANVHHWLRWAADI
jgi:hypothetical protein